MQHIEETVRRSVFINNFIADARGGNLSHAYMVVGDDTESLDTAVTVMEQAIYCRDNACGVCNICSRIINGNHTNISTYDTYNRDIIDEIIERSYIQPAENGANLFVLKNFDTVPTRLQNALLKTVEEPQDGVVIILTACNESAVLSTIKSRVKKIHLNIWDKKTIHAELTARGYSSEAAEFAAGLCAQSLTRALALADNGEAKETYDDMLDMLINIQNSSMIPNYLRKFGVDRNRFAAKLEMMELIFYNAMKDRVNGIDTQINQAFSVAAISNILESIADAEAKIKVNIAIDNIVTDLLLSILEIRFRTS